MSGSAAECRMVVKILLCHSHYQIRAGECLVVSSEADLLRAHGHQVVEFFRNNTAIRAMSLPQKLLLLFRGINNRRAAREITEIIQREKPDIAHVHNVFPLISPSIYRAIKRQNVPIVQTIHNFRFLCLNGLLFINNAPCHRCVHHSFMPGILRRCLRHSLPYSLWYAVILTWHRWRGTFLNSISQFIVLNSFTRAIFVDAGFPAARIQVKPNAAAVDTAACTDTPERHALFIGRFSPEKGLPTLLRAAEQAPYLPIKIIGSGPLEEQLRAQVQRRNLTQIEFLGSRSPEECNRFMAQALVTVFPSECYENCPLTVINSLALGTPVIAARTGGVPDFVPDGKHVGWLFTPGNADELAERLRWIADHIDEVIALRPAVRAWGRKQFSAETNYERLMAIYRSAE